MAEPEADDAVGFGRPPKANRFKRGQSGNPRGRPKGARNLSTDLRDELSEKIRIRESGKELRVSKQRATVKSLVAAAVKGDVRATTALLALCARVFMEPEDRGKPDELSATDAQILSNFVDREITKRGKKNLNDNQPDTDNTIKENNDEA